MTDDYAIEGESAGYVPCGQQAAQLVVDEEGAISGRGTGFVAGGSASPLPAVERGAVVGSGVGYVPGPCRIVIDDFSDFVKAFPHAGTDREDLLYDTTATTSPDNGEDQGIDGTDGGAWYEAHAYVEEDETLGLWWCVQGGGSG